MIPGHQTYFTINLVIYAFCCNLPAVKIMGYPTYESLRWNDYWTILYILLFLLISCLMYHLSCILISAIKRNHKYEKMYLCYDNKQEKLIDEE